MPSKASAPPSVSDAPSVVASSPPSVSDSPSAQASAAPSTPLVCAVIASSAFPFIVTAQHSQKAMHTTPTNTTIIQLPADAAIEAESNHWEFYLSETPGYYHIQNSLFNTALVLGDVNQGGPIFHGPFEGDPTMINDNWCFVDQGGGYYAIISEASGLAVTVDQGSYDDDVLFLQLPFQGFPWQKFQLTPREGVPVPMPISSFFPSLSMEPSVAPSLSLIPSVSEPSLVPSLSLIPSLAPSETPSDVPSLSLVPSQSDMPSQSAAPSNVNGCADLQTGIPYHITARHSAKAIYADPNGIDVYQLPVSTSFAFDDWQFVQSDANGYYHIQNAEYGTVLGVSGSSTIENRLITQTMPSNLAISDNWCFVDAGLGGFYYIISQVSGLAVSVRSGSFENGALYAQLPYNQTEGQLFLLTHVQNVAPPPIAPSPITSLAPVAAPVLPPPALSACIPLDTNLTYHILGRRSGRGLFTAGGDEELNEYVIELPAGASEADNWILEKSSLVDNHYHIINAYSGFAMHIDGFTAVVMAEKSATLLTDDWCFQETELGYVQISSVETAGEVLMVSITEYEPYPIIPWTFMGWHVQQFMLFPVNENFTGSKGLWEGPYNLPIIPASMANLPDGKILAWAAVSGNDLSASGDGTATAIWDPISKNSTEYQVVHTEHDMFCPGTSVLPDTRVLITGGNDAEQVTIYDPRNDTWYKGSKLNYGRGYHSQTLTSDGSVFTVGGSYTGLIGDKPSELWNVTTGDWELKPGINSIPFRTQDIEGPYRSDNHAWLFEAPNGYIFHAGPSQRMHWLDLEGNGTITPSIKRGDDLDAMEGSVVMFDVGMILKVGGCEDYDFGRASNRAYVINITDPNGNLDVSVERTGDMLFERIFPSSIVLPNGQVIIAGGMTASVLFSDAGAVLVCELWDPETGVFTQLATMSIPRTYHSAALLGKDGRVIMGGGGVCGGCSADHPDIEILTPPYLLNDDDTLKVRPAILSAPDTAEYGVEFTAVVDTNATHTFAMVRTGAATHSTNNDVRRVKCDIVSTDGNGSYNLTFPDSPSVTLPGVWFLFAMNEEGTPSEAETVMIHPL